MVVRNIDEQVATGKIEVEWTDFADAVAVFTAALVAYYPLGDHELASLVAMIGGLILISRLIIQSKVRSVIHHLKNAIDRKLEPLDQLKAYIDLSRSNHLQDIAGLANLYTSITEPEFSVVKDRALRDASRRLEQLVSQKRSDELGTAEYYSWLLPMLEDIKPGEKLRAVSLMNGAEWDDSSYEREFFQKHIAAAARGVHIDRIFIVDRAEFPRMLSIEAVKAHCCEVRNGINGYLLFKDWFQSHDPGLLKQVRDGFIIVGNRVALIDTFTPAGEVRGYVAMNPADLSRLIELFDQLKIVATPLSSTIATVLGDH